MFTKIYLGLARERAWDVVDGGSASPSSTNDEQICLTFFGVLIMEASVLGGQHRSKKTMDNTTSPPCVCCETQIGGSGRGFLPRQSPPPATIKIVFLISPSCLFFSRTHPLSASFFDLWCCGGFGLFNGSKYVWVMVEFDCGVWWWWIW